MNWVKINGVPSETLVDLIVMELPAITRPAMRTEITEIDGKDGDIIDNLGYQSYDKTIKIGLHGSYDINAVAKFFSNGGEVVFSNESDKVYVADSIEQIDFERLVTFRTADVKFHVQPYKYLLSESAVDLNITAETSLSVTNAGLEISKPVITLYGSGEVTISIGGVAIFEVNIDDSYLTVDSMLEECYKGTTSTLKNRKMTGEFPTLQPGSNAITWTGTLTKIIVQPKSRWL